MNVLLSADRFYPSQAGGPCNTIYWLAKALSRAGHQVRVVATAQDLSPDVPTNTWLERDCGRVIYTRNPHFYVPTNHIWQGWRAMQSADVVHVNSLFYPASVCWVLMARLRKKRVIWSVHGELSPEALTFSPRRKKVVLPLLRLISRPVWFHATCSAEAAFIRQHFGSHCLVDELANQLELPSVVQRQAGPRQAGPYLLFIGRLHPIKAVDRLLDALAESAVFQQSPYQLLIAGPDAGDYADQLKTQAQQLNLTKKVRFVGAVQGVEKQALYANALVTVLPSHAENFGNVVVESLAQGTPVVASTQTPWATLATAGAGHWVPNDPVSLRTTLETYLTMPPADYEQYRQRSIDLAQRYDVHRNVHQWERLYVDGLVLPMQSQAAKVPNAVTFHDAIAPQFDQKYTDSAAFRERYRVWTNLLDQCADPTDRVLDLGCGSGVFSRYLADKGCTVTGIDGSAEMIRICREKNCSPNAHYVVQTLPLDCSCKYGEQDVILASSVLEYVDDLPAVVRQVHDMLQPGGLLILSIPNRQSLYRRLERGLFTLTGYPRYFAHIRHRTTAPALIQLLDELGFRTLEVDYFSQDPLSRRLSGLMPPSYVNNLLIGVFQKR